MNAPADAVEIKNWSSVRTVLEGMILAALLWTGNSIGDMKVQMATLQTQLASVNSSLADVRELKATLAATRQDVALNGQRISSLERATR